MKKTFVIVILILTVSTLFFSCGAKNSAGNPPETSEAGVPGGISKETAYEGVSNYCHSAYDWSAAEENPSIMYVEMGEETDTEYLVVFRSYTGAFVYFHVDKSTGTARMEEYVPALDEKTDAGTICVTDYLGGS